MIMSLKQKKIKCRPRIKLNSFSMESLGEGGRGGGVVTIMLLSPKKRILICFDSASYRVQPTVPTLFLLSDTDQSNNNK